MLRAWIERARERRSERALERQLDYQRAKADALTDDADELARYRTMDALAVRAKLDAVRPIAEDARVLEVGSGPHGLVFFFGTKDAVGVDPLADEYARLFPQWQGRARTLRAFGESLPFAAGSFDIVLSDNCVDHARDPSAILREISRVLRPGGLFYFSVNVHHGIYSAVSRLHGAWSAAGFGLEITPFADHTVHLTLRQAQALFDGLPLRIVYEHDSIAETTRQSADIEVRQPLEHVKRLFFKNALYEVIAVRTGESQANDR
jgi:SAM-dependent methyltransferase